MNALKNSLVTKLNKEEKEKNEKHYSILKFIKGELCQFHPLTTKNTLLNMCQSMPFESKIRLNCWNQRNLLKIPERFSKKWKTLFDFNAFKVKLLFSCVNGKILDLKYLPKFAVWFKNSLKVSCNFYKLSLTIS